MRRNRVQCRHAYPVAWSLSLALLMALAPTADSAAADAPVARAAALGKAPPSVPDTAAGQRLSAFILTFNGGDAGALHTLVASSFEAAEQDSTFVTARAADLQHLYAMTGGLALRRIERASATGITALAQGAETSAWYRLSIFTSATPPAFMEPAPPHKIVGMGIDAIPAPPDLAEAGLDERQWRGRLDQLMDFLCARDRFAGAVLVQRRGRAVYGRACGESDRDAHVRTELRTRFNLASITKMFTAVAVGQLVQAGKLRLSDPVGKVLPELADTELGQRVAVHHLLSHTSGIVGAREAIQNGLEPARTARSIAEMTDSFVHAPLTSRPGQQFDYSNAGYILLGAIIERVSGESYHAYVQRHVFDAAGMRETGFYAPDDDRRHFATGYKDGPSGARVPNTSDLPLIGSPANMAFSTVGDMARFADALYRGRLLPRELRERFWTGVTEQPDGVEYGYGARIEHYNGRRFVWHGGGAPGVTNRFEMAPDEAATVVVLSNVDTEPEIIANKLREWLFPRGPSAMPVAPPPTLALSLRPLQAMAAGREAAFELVVSNTGGPAHAVVVDFEIKDRDGQKVEQQYVAGQRLEASQTRTFRFAWTPKQDGSFRIDAGVFAPGWSRKLVFEDGLAFVQVP